MEIFGICIFLTSIILSILIYNLFEKDKDTKIRLKELDVELYKEKNKSDALEKKNKG